MREARMATMYASPTHAPTTARSAAPALANAAPTPRPEVRAKVKQLLLKSPAFAQLPQKTRDELAHNMTRIADYLAAPEGVPGNQLAQGLAAAPAAHAMWNPFEPDVFTQLGSPSSSRSARTCSAASRSIVESSMEGSKSKTQMSG